ncbi:sugar ABC transporter ATP-binding protein [Candidatus Leptofilum sp.]|uniref:sugar ABC transporter ATP-binding protein n=1 Tax=Candidatus Leptofilum sp. TaxID=3241576 RepID=UPI003B5BB959
MTDVSLSAQHIVKRYGGVTALADGNLEIKAGEVVALLGANGSGKSTLSKIITGVVAPDEGQLFLDDQPMQFATPQAATRLGISAVYQELSLIPDMSVAENIWLGHEPLRFGLGLDQKAMRQQTEVLLNLFEGTFQPDLTPDVPVSTLPPDERQLVEILKAYSLKPRLLILDEATASLDGRQVVRLFELVKRWIDEGMAIVFISHRMNEIFQVADRVTILTNGCTVGTMPLSETSEQEIVDLMIEGAIPPEETTAAKHTVPADAPVRLRVNNLRTNVLNDVSLEVRDGELLGIGGLQGQGQNDLLLALFGAVPYSGDVTLSGEQVHFTHPRQAMAKDVAFVPGDRTAEGLLLIRSILENLQLPSWSKYGRPLNMKDAASSAQTVVSNLKLKMSALDAPVSTLSGGNAQKVVIGKWLLRQPKLLLLNDPTKGVDVGAKSEFYQLLIELRRSDTAILFYSSDDEELLGLCDRILIMHDGNIHTELAGERLDRKHLVAASLGATHENEPNE